METFDGILGSAGSECQSACSAFSLDKEMYSFEDWSLSSRKNSAFIEDFDCVNVDILPLLMIDTPLTSSDTSGPFDKGVIDFVQQDEEQLNSWNLYAGEAQTNDLMEELREANLRKKPTVVQYKNEKSWNVQISLNRKKTLLQEILIRDNSYEAEGKECPYLQDHNVLTEDFDEKMDLDGLELKLMTLEEMKKDPKYWPLTEQNTELVPRLHSPPLAISENSMSFPTRQNHNEGEYSDKYYSRINIKELSYILGLENYHIALTRDVETFVLTIFKKCCKFKLGYQTWIRDTDKQERRALLDKLFRYTSKWFPELDKFKLEVIIRRGSYSKMQRRLRKERRISKRVSSA